MFYGFFAGCLKIIAPGVGFLAQFFCPRSRGFALFSFSGRGGESGFRIFFVPAR